MFASSQGKTEARQGKEAVPSSGRPISTPTAAIGIFKSARFKVIVWGDYIYRLLYLPAVLHHGFNAPIATNNLASAKVSLCPSAGGRCLGFLSSQRSSTLARHL